MLQTKQLYFIYSLLAHLEIDNRQQNKSENWKMEKANLSFSIDNILSETNYRNKFYQNRYNFDAVYNYDKFQLVNYKYFTDHNIDKALEDISYNTTKNYQRDCNYCFANQSNIQREQNKANIISTIDEINNNLKTGKIIPLIYLNFYL